MKTSVLVALLVALAVALPAVAAEAGKVESSKSVSQYGVTWTFDKEVPVGKFVTGDYYVVGPVTVTSVIPAPAGSGKQLRNGSMLNPPTTTAVAYDGRIRGLQENLAAKFPLAMKPGDSLVSAVSLEELQQNQTLPNPTRSKEYSPLKTLAVLTCLAKAAPADAFRPAYCDREKDKAHTASEIQWERLPKIKTAKGMPELAKVERWFQRPWIDHVYGWHSRETHASENIPGYGREVGRAVSYAALILCLDLPQAKKETVCHRLIQVGIDNWAIAKRSKRGSAGGWPAAGGFGNGRKLPIVFAAVLLQDKEMLSIRKHAAEASFGEDEHVEFGPSWTAAKVRFTGQYPLIGHQQIDRGPYEHLPPSQWPGNRKTMSEGYRRCCTSICWVGQSLAVKLLGAERVWDHDAFFAYVDRWMHQDDTETTKEIKKAHSSWRGGVPQGTTQFDPWIDKMWAKHRPTLKPDPLTSWK